MELGSETPCSWLVIVFVMGNFHLSEIPETSKEAIVR